ncbi:MAG: hypothetical protein EOO28_17700 [Comamonadaceae bacterium]|nr:MAG: hypothetical protein EOO28_17700 [Comamonadaceae bacterium]
MSISTSEKAEMALPADPQAVDTHLVMNAMNQIAARDISISGVENPLLFALSDYLRESLSRLDTEIVSLRSAIKLAEAHLMLHACVAHGTMDFAVRGCPAEPFRVARGVITELAMGSLKGLRFPAQGPCKLELSFAQPEKEGLWISFSMEFFTTGRWAGSEPGPTESFMSGLAVVRAGDVVVDMPRMVVSPQGATLFFSMRLVSE